MQVARHIHFIYTLLVARAQLIAEVSRNPIFAGILPPLNEWLTGNVFEPQYLVQP